MKTKALTKVSCGDWHRSWGMGTNKIGDLRRGTQDDIFVWTGHAQGRHGQKLTKRYSVTFRANDEGRVTEILDNQSGNSLPDYRDIQRAISQLTGEPLEA